MKKPVLVLAITAVATFVMGWVAHRVYKNSQITQKEISKPVIPATTPEPKPVSADSIPKPKDSMIYQHTNYIPPKPDTTNIVATADEVLKFIPAKRFADFPVTTRHKSGLLKKLDFSTCSSGQLYKDETKQAIKKGAVFAGKFAFTTISCDSNCFSSTIVDLKTGSVYAGPHATTGFKYRIDSRLLYVNPPKADSTYNNCFDCTPELYVWTGKLFKKIQ